MLDLFKQKKSFLTRAKENTALKYLLSFDENGAFAEVCDKKLKPLKTVDFRVYNGLDREILQIMQKSEEEAFLHVSWENESGHLYLHEYPRLLELLVQSDKLFDAHDEPIVFEDGTSEVDLKILSSKDDKLLGVPCVNGADSFQFLSPEYILANHKIRKIKDIGENFNQIFNFDTVIEKDKLEEFLTIFVSHFSNVNILYEAYEVVSKKEKKLIKPAVIFEKVTSDNELILRVSATIAKLDPEFFHMFSISKIALVNTLESTISIYECDFSEVFEMYSTIFKNLSALKRKFKESSFSEEDGLFVCDEKIAGEFILQHLQTLIHKVELFGSEKLKAYKYSTKKPTLHIAFKDKVDFLGSEDVQVSIGEDEFSIFEMINLYKKHAYIPLSNGEKSIVDKSYISRLERIFKKEGKEIKVSFFDLPEIEELIAQKEQKVFKDSRKFYEGFNSLKSSRTRLPKLNEVTLRDYQKYGVKWLKYLYDNGFGGCLADDMGLGKTIQTISLFSYIYPKSKTPSLVVMPKSLLSNWQNEIQKFNPNLTFYLYYGQNRDIKDFENYNIILSTYAIVRNDIEKLKEVTFDTIVLDESQQIKNIDSKISKAIMLLNAEHKFALSGTPIENSLLELYALFRFINNGMFSSANDFKNHFAVPIQADANEEVAKILKAKISPFMLRRLKQDVLKDLPPKQEQVIYVDMDEEHKNFYLKKQAYYRQILQDQIQINGIEKSKFAIFQAFNDLRQIASAPELKSENKIPSSKIDTLFDMLEDIIANNHKVLIFANYLGSLDLIANKADEKGYQYLTMTGSTRDRATLVEKFQTDKKQQLFLMTLKVGGTGLNLTAADYVFIFDPWWNKAAENQAVDRTHRIGQKNKVFSYRMITKDTIEEKILELQNQKQDLTDMVISGDEGGLKQLSVADLDFILG